MGNGAKRMARLYRIKPIDEELICDEELIRDLVESLAVAVIRGQTQLTVNGVDIPCRL